MVITPARLIATAVLLLIVFVTGFVLHRPSGAYNVALLTVHKLLALLAAVLFGAMIRGLNAATPLSALEWVAVSAAGLFFVLAVATGGVLSGAKNPPASIVTIAHQVAPFLTALAAGLALYLPLAGR